MGDTTSTITDDGETSGPMPSWITPALLAHTIAVWSKRYNRPIHAREAVELLTRIGRLMDVLIQPAAPKSHSSPHPSRR